MNLATYMAFQNDAGAAYVLDEPLVPYKQISVSEIPQPMNQWLRPLCSGRNESCEKLITM